MSSSDFQLIMKILVKIRQSDGESIVFETKDIEQICTIARTAENHNLAMQEAITLFIEGKENKDWQKMERAYQRMEVIIEYLRGPK